MRFAIVGAGAMGSVVGAHLQRAGNPVTLVDVDEQHIGAVQRDGLRVQGWPEGDVVVPIQATTDPSTLDTVDAMIFLCKGWATHDAAAGVAHALAPDGWAVTIQNGLGNDRILGEVVGVDRAVPGTTTVGAMKNEPGVVIMSPGTAAGESLTHVGPPRSATKIPAGVLEVAATMTAAGLPTEALPDAEEVIWTKLAMAASMGCLTAALRRTVKDVIDDEWAYGLWQDMFDEIMSVGAAEGVDLDAKAVFDHCDKTYRSVGHHVTSMAADVVAGRRTEIDSMALEVARRGAEHGVPTPVVSTIGRVVKSLESSYERAL
jgi:2-dehydropantoate 2-reductase